jgi:hypothetical protein
MFRWLPARSTCADEEGHAPREFERETGIVQEADPVERKRVGIGAIRQKGNAFQKGAANVTDPL